MKIPPLRLLFDLKRFDFDSEGTKQRLAQGSGEVLIDEITRVEKCDEAGLSNAAQDALRRAIWLWHLPP